MLAAFSHPSIHFEVAILNSSMSAPKIQITLKLGQPLKVEVLDVRGSSCTKLTEALDKLGQSSTTIKPEFYEEANLRVTDSVNIGD
jgi:hypothetical protein